MSPSPSQTWFVRTQKVESDYSPHVFTEYVSQRTGMRLVVVDQRGPKVLGWFTAATEITDDSGSPHTLEHLCFMGSKNYPYKGLLDKLATRAYSTTNAWTATDHTAYTLESCGYAAFAQILPVYLEHVILPTLTDEGCYTEVHHINGDGCDAGVVYSEMQGVQNQQAELMELCGKRLMYPEGVGFRYETGGMMEQLRVLTAERIRQFHRDMYQPKNLCVIVVGEVDHKHLLATLDSFESTILTDIPQPGTYFKRPWLDSPQPTTLKNSIVRTVEFPEEDESVGEISIKYFGPHCDDLINSTAISILLSYLAGTSASILELIMVEKEQLASAVYYYTTPRPDTVIEFTLSGVDAMKLSEVESRFHQILIDASDKPIDMTYMGDCLARERRQQMFQAESSDSFFTSGIISTFLFSVDRKLDYLAHLGEFDVLENWSESEWRRFFKHWLIDNKYVTILGKPSAAISKKIKTEEEARIMAQKRNLGKEGLDKLQKKLEEAKAYNDREVPTDLLENFVIPATDSIRFITTLSARSGLARGLGVPDNDIQRIVDHDENDLPLFIHFEHIPSNFVIIHLLICTSSVPVFLRPLLSIYMENFFTTPIQRDGQNIAFEQVVVELFRDTVHYSLYSGSELGNSEILDIKFQVESKKYARAILWIRDLLWNALFDVERIQSTTARLLADVPEAKRDGSEMSSAVSDMINDAPGALDRARGTLVKALYLQRLKRLLKTSPDSVIKQLEELRHHLAQFSNFRALVIGDIEAMHNPVSCWEPFAKGNDVTKPLLPLDKRLDRFSAAGIEPGNLSYVIPMSTIDSSYLLSTTKGPVNSKDSRVPALMVAIAYLDAVEGPMWTAVRGTGLAYGTGFRRRIGRLEYSVFRSPDSYKALATSKKVVEDFVSGATSFDALALEGAISSIVLSLANQEATMGEAAADKFVLEVVKGLPRNWNDIILEKVRAITINEIKAAMKESLLPLFRPDTANLFVTCAPIMQEKLISDLKNLGFAAETKPLTFFQDDYGLKCGDDENSEIESGSGSDSDNESDSDNDRYEKEDDG